VQTDGEQKVNKGFIRLLSLFLAVNILITGILCMSSPAKAFYEKEKAKISFKIFELKRKEKIEIKKLTKSQENLEDTKNSIVNCQSKLETSRSHLKKLQHKLNKLSVDQEGVADSAGKRIKELYKGERLNILHLIFASSDSSTFLDRIYYQKIIAQKDKTLLDNLRARSREIDKSRMSVEYEKNNIASTLNVMNQKKNDLNSSIKSSQFLINKLRTDRATYEKAQQELEYLSNKLENQLRHSKVTKMIANSKFIKPIAGAITSPFGWRRHPIFGSRRFHTGVDISNSYGTPIKASNGGKVIYSGWYGGYGKVIIIDHGNMDCGSYKGERFSTLYAHMSTTAVGNGSSVKKGQVVGYEGTTGYSTGPHVHFEVRINGKPNNPLSFVRM
jgi:murein DD-endopeptidase MepM/ murein hydrolase activator NlpD